MTNHNSIVYIYFKYISACSLLLSVAYNNILFPNVYISWCVQAGALIIKKYPDLTYC